MRSRWIYMLMWSKLIETAKGCSTWQFHKDPTVVMYSQIEMLIKETRNLNSLVAIHVLTFPDTKRWVIALINKETRQIQGTHID